MSLAALESKARERAAILDRADPLAALRRSFAVPAHGTGESIYLGGNSLGLAPRKAREYLLADLGEWERLGVEGYFAAERPFVAYTDELLPSLARIVGAQPREVAVMHSLTANLHLLMVSFFRPTPARHKILMERNAFPSDRYAIASQLAWHGLDPARSLVELSPRPGEDNLRPEDISARIALEGDALALVFLGNVNYLSGEAFDAAGLCAQAHRVGAIFALDLAHGAGNLELRLHDWNVDFAVWCHYKYLNAGPGATGGAFVHERHLGASGSHPRFAGWWGHERASRMKMPERFQPADGAESWALSNSPVLQLAALRASLELFESAGGMPALREKSLKQTDFLRGLLGSDPLRRVQILTPAEPERRGCQLSLRIHGGDAKRIQAALRTRGLICDAREPDVLRFAPTPLYNSFLDCALSAFMLFEVLEAA